MRDHKILGWIRRRWRFLLWIFTVLLSLGLCGLLLHLDRQNIAALTPQTAAERWETEEKPYAMASLFLPEEKAVSPERIGEIRLGVENKLLAAGVGSETHPWFYAFSRTQTATLTSESASAEVELNVITGDYFRIHPMVLRSGWYMQEDSVMHDRIVLDRQSAWDLFYSDNVVGLYVELGGSRYQVAAVVDTEPGKYNEMAAEGKSRAWVYYDGPGLDATKGFTTLEVVLPQPVKNFAATTLRSVLESNISESTLVTDNSGRFSLENRWTTLQNIATRGITSDAVAYPYFENAARLTENHLALMLIPEALLLLYPLVSLVLWLIMLNRRRTWGFHSIVDFGETLIDKRNIRNYEKKLRASGKYPEPEEVLPYEEEYPEEDYDEYYDDGEYDDGYDDPEYDETEETWE